MLKRSEGRIAIRSIVLSILVVGTLVTAMGGQRMFETPPAGASFVDVYHPFLVPDRAHLAICVAIVGAEATEETGQLRIASIVTEIAGDPQWEASSVAIGPPVVDAGCPQQGFLLARPDVAAETRGRKVIPYPADLRVERASPFFLFVFVLPDEQVHVLFGDSPMRVAPQEMLCQQGTCATSTNGLYISESELMDDEILTEWLLKGLGLVPIVPFENVAPESEKLREQRP